MHNLILKTMVGITKVIPPILGRATIRALLPAYCYFADKSLAKYDYYRELNTQMRISFAYDGALDGYGCPRDSPEFLQHFSDNMLHSLSGTYPMHIVVESILALDSTPKLLRWRVQSLVWLLKMGLKLKKDVSLWQHYAIAILYTILIMLLIMLGVN